MPIRIVHVADCHIGLPFKQYQGSISDRLIDERFDALARLVDDANNRSAQFLVVAGDLFDTTRVSDSDVTRAANVLRGFAGEAAIVIPGNHDYYTGTDDAIWRTFRRAIESASNIDLLVEPTVKTYEVDGQKVHFFPCPCPSKTGSQSTTDWVTAAATQYADGLRIGIAHGNVTGLGLDAEGHYFNMEPEALASAGVATWLLGHIHVPFPTVERGERSPYFMAGTHTPDSLRCRHGGAAWYLECNRDSVVRYERLAPGRLRFIRFERELTSEADVAALVRGCEDLVPSETVLDLQLTGRLSPQERATLDSALDGLRPRFLHLTTESEFHSRVDAAQVESLYRSGGLSHRVLTGLLADAEYPDAATLAHELIQEVQRA